MEGGGSAAAALSRPRQTVALQFTAPARKLERWIAEPKPDRNLSVIQGFIIDNAGKIHHENSMSKKDSL